LVEEYLSQGGAQIIEEFNEGIEDKDPQAYWQSPQ
jgi:hypothetical protein